MKLQPVKIYRPDKNGNLKLVKIISQKQVMKMADEKFANKKVKNSIQYIYSTKNADKLSSNEIKKLLTNKYD